MFIDEERKHVVECEDKEVMESDDNDVPTIHVHVYNTLTEVADDHQHVVLGVSSPADRVGRSHVHPIRTRTSFVDGHWHWVDITTDRAVIMPEDTHCHYFAGRTSKDCGHCHDFADVTTLSPDLCEEEIVTPPKPCKYKYKRPEEEEYN